jgi:hypothetical protein
MDRGGNMSRRLRLVITEELRNISAISLVLYQQVYLMHLPEGKNIDIIR